MTKAFAGRNILSTVGGIFLAVSLGIAVLFLTLGNALGFLFGSFHCDNDAYKVLKIVPNSANTFDAVYALTSGCGGATEGYTVQVLITRHGMTPNRFEGNSESANVVFSDENAEPKSLVWNNNHTLEIHFAFTRSISVRVDKFSKSIKLSAGPGATAEDIEISGIYE